MSEPLATFTIALGSAEDVALKARFESGAVGPFEMRAYNHTARVEKARIASRTEDGDEVTYTVERGI